MRVFLVCPANMATGGTELLHQFGKHLTDAGVENYMVYPDADGIHCPTPDTFLKYGVKYVSGYVDAKDSVLVLSETQIHLVKECQKGTAMIWWLSVNNYFNAYRGRLSEENVDIFGLRERNNVIHFVQSHYAMEFVTGYFQPRQCYFLKDYINDDIVEYARDNKNRYERGNICLYNPKKGYEALKPVMDACREDIIWVPLINMKPHQMADAMCKAKLYVDFGAHPGKDRIPREAAVCGCCVITNREGSAAYQGDVNIPEVYKVENPGEVQEVLAKIYEIVDRFEEITPQYEEYRSMILSEKEEFLEDMQSSIDLLKEAVTEKNEIKDTPEALDIPKEEYAELLRSIGQAAETINSLAENAKAACLAGDLSEAMNGLLTMDYVLNMIRETAYAELIDMSNR